MQVSLSRWGNSLGLRIPKEVAGLLGLHPGAQVEVAMEGGRIVISCLRPRYRLEDLLAAVTPDIRTAFDWGPDRGRENPEDAGPGGGTHDG